MHEVNVTSNILGKIIRTSTWNHLEQLSGYVYNQMSFYHPFGTESWLSQGELTTMAITVCPNRFCPASGSAHRWKSLEDPQIFSSEPGTFQELLGA